MKKKAARILDVHIQTSMGQGELTVEQIVKICARRKVDAGICDRVSGTDSPLNSEKKFSRYLAELRKHKVQKSAELDISCGLRLPGELLDELDYVVRGLHHYKTRSSDAYVSFFDEKGPVPDLDYFRDWTLNQFANTIENEAIDIVAHPTLVPASLRGSAEEVFTDEWKDDLLSLAAMNEVAFEISGRFGVPDEEFVTECLKRGIGLALASGGRTADEVGNMAYPLSLVEKLEIPEFLIYPNNDLGFDEF